MDWSEGKGQGPRSGAEFCPSRKEAARREQAQRDRKKRGAVVSRADGLERGQRAGARREPHKKGGRRASPFDRIYFLPPRRLPRFSFMCSSDSLLSELCMNCLS